jgi:S-adenosylmethionine decarboxylase
MCICPDILRQRLVVEGIHGIPQIDERSVRQILAGLTHRLGMTPISETLVFSPDKVSRLHHGVGGFQAWAESGCSLYTWRDSRLFTLDVYSCKRFEAQACIDYIGRTLQPVELDWRQV